MAKRITVETTEQDRQRLIDIKEGSINAIGYKEAISYVLSSLGLMEQTANGKQKAILLINKWLCLGHDVPITVTELRKWSGVRSDSCERAIELLSDQVNEFNKQFNK